MKATYDINYEPIVISKVTIDRILKSRYPTDCLSVYVFYYYTAKWQKMSNDIGHSYNQIKCTTNYTAVGLGISEDRVIRAKKELIELGLIEDIVKRGDGNKITGHFIKVNFIYENHTPEKAEGGEPTPPIPDRVENQETNTDITISLNTDITNSKMLVKISPFEIVCNEWFEYKKSRRETYKNAKSIEMFKKKLYKLSLGNPDTARLIIEQSMENNYAGVFPLKNDGQSTRQNAKGFGRDTAEKWANIHKSFEQ